MSLIGVSLWFITPLALGLSSAPEYVRLKGAAEPINNLGKFLESYVGDCESDEPTFDRRGCLKKAAAVRKEERGKLYLLEFDEPRDQIQKVEWDRKKEAYRVHLIPFFSARGIGLSVGKPQRLNRQGFPIVRNVPIWVKRPPDEPDFAFRRSLERGMVRLEVLVKVGKAWSMRRKKKDKVVRGTAVRLVGLRMYPGRGEQVLAEQVYP